MGTKKDRSILIEAWKWIMPFVMLWHSVWSQVCPNHCFCTSSETTEMTMKLISCIRTFPEEIPITTNHLAIIGATKKVLTSNDTSRMAKIHILELMSLEMSEIEDDAFGVHNLKNLLTLRLTDNNIQAIHKNTFKSLINLNELFMDNNAISYVHEEAFISLTKLKILHLQNNKLKNTPNFHQNLLILNLNNNDIHILNISDPNMKLESLDLCNNKFQVVSQHELHIPQTLKNLCLGNELKSMNPEIFHGNNLKCLNLQTIYGVSLNTLNVINSLSGLQTLSISTTNLDEFSSFIFTNLTKISSLSLKNVTSSVNINENFFKPFHNLTELDICGSTGLSQQILSFNTHQNHLSKIQILRAINSGIRSMPNISVTFTKLNELDINDNPLICDCNLWEVTKKYNKKELMLHQASRIKCYKASTKKYYKIIAKNSSQFLCLENSARESKGFEIYDDSSEDLFTIILDEEIDIPTRAPKPPRHSVRTSNDIIYLIVTILATVLLVLIVMLCIYRNHLKCCKRSRSNVFTIFKH